MAKSVLIIATSHDKLGDTGKPTGCWAEEIMAPYLMFTENGLTVTIASIKGGKIPIDAGSLSDSFITEKVKTFQSITAAMALLEHSTPISEIASGADYDAIFVPGGHGCCFDMPENAKLQELLASCYDAGNIVSSVCHGPTGVVNVTLKDGSKLCAGKKVTGFCNTEEEAVGLVDAIPFLLEDALKAAGGGFCKGEDWAPYATEDERLILGQNPQSSEKVAELVIAALAK